MRRSANAEPCKPKSRKKKMAIELQRCSHLIQESLWPWSDVTEANRKPSFKRRRYNSIYLNLKWKKKKEEEKEKNKKLQAGVRPVTSFARWRYV